jgi:outer membrane immunogenic protein
VFGAATLPGGAKTDWIATVAARFGYAANNSLFCGKASGGWVHNSGRVTEVTAVGNVFSVNASNTNSGWLVGGGVEYGFTPNWTMRVEYDHLGLSNLTRRESSRL